MKFKEFKKIVLEYFYQYTKKAKANREIQFKDNPFIEYYSACFYIDNKLLELNYVLGEWDIRWISINGPILLNGPKIKTIQECCDYLFKDEENVKQLFKKEIKK